MKGKSYTPIPVETYMSDYGYRIVTISVAPGTRLSIMVANPMLDAEGAVAAALATAGALKLGKEY